MTFSACRTDKDKVEGQKLSEDKPSKSISEVTPIPRKVDTIKSNIIKDKLDLNIPKAKVKTEVAPKAKKVDANFTHLSSENGVKVDIKYATKDNFTKKQIYPCGKCYLRPEPAKAILKVNQILKEKNLSLKMFDCYRPRPAQQRLWDVVPNPDYVTPPSKGSMHNRGLAVDLTIVDDKGKELDMGTPYDFFGVEAHTDNTSLPAKVLENRKLLSSVMKQVGFDGIRTEWWHFSYKTTAELADWEWPCN
jgi:zinc D-Ala-D-Ala dipeptidase